MTDQIIYEWLSEFNEIEPAKVPDFSESILRNEDLFQAITHVLEENERFKPLYNDVIGTLFSFFRSSEKRFKQFASQFIPTLIYIYLQQIHHQKKCVALETLLSGIFEMESSAEDRPPSSVRIPNVNLPSIYHESPSISASWISDKDLERLNAKTIKVMNRPNLELTDERMRAPQRLPLCTEIWWYFNHRLCDLPTHAVPTYLKTISRIMTRGFSNVGGGQPRNSSPGRINLSSKLLIEMVQTIYFAIYNGAPSLAEQVLEEALNRANYQLWPDAMMVCIAVKDYLNSSDILLHQVVEPQTSFKKSIITNASFRTKKLPDDIPIITESDGSNTDQDTPDVGLIAKSKSKLPHILAKIKEKRNSTIVINEESGEFETTLTPEVTRKKSTGESV